MLKKMVLAACIVSCVLFMNVSWASARDFSADMIGRSAEGTFEGKMYVSGSNIRMEIPGAVTITRSDKKVVWVLMPSENMYMEQPIDPENVIAAGAAESGEVERKPLGADMVGGRNTNKFQVTYRYEGVSSSVYEWVDSSISMPIKIAAVDGSWSMEYNNIKAGPQDPSLFDVPAGYQKFTMPAMPTGF